MLSFPKLLTAILISYIERFGGNPTKTKLLKLAYLAEVEYMRRHGQRLAEVPWIYFLYGPYVRDYDQVLDLYFDTENVETSEEHTAMLVHLGDLKDDYKPDLVEKTVIAAVVDEFGGLNLKDLLNHVYFETEPMMASDRRNEPLDFSTIQSAAYYHVKPLSIPKIAERTIRNEYRRKAKERGGG